MQNTQVTLEFKKQKVFFSMKMHKNVYKNCFKKKFKFA